jgi:nucleoside-diphosphate-sugar epimerase
MSKSILVTGGTGFIGSNIVKYFKDKHNVVVIDRKFKKTNTYNNVEYLEFDLLNHDKLDLFLHLLTFQLPIYI